MVRRTRRADGSPFWGCPKFPNCRGTRPMGSEPAVQVRVRWDDATLDRTGWKCRYTTAGGRLRASASLSDLSKEFRQCWIARTQQTSIAPEAVRRVTGSIRKVIQRGANPPVHPDAERELLVSLGLGSYLHESTMPGDIGVRLEPDLFRELSGARPCPPGPGFVPHEEVPLESDHERHFITGWVPQNLGDGAPRWFVPQASFDALTARDGRQGSSERRVDFLVHPPFGTPFVVEIDGAQHECSSSPDRERGVVLAEVGIKVVRVPTSELDQGQGRSLERVKSLWKAPQEDPDERLMRAVLVPPSIHRLVVALLDAVDYGFLGGRRWVVEVDGEPDIAHHLLWPYLRLFCAMDTLWGPCMMPEEVLLKTRAGWARYEPRSSREPLACDSPEEEPDLIIRLQPQLTGHDRLGYPQGATPEIVVRSARLPVLVGDDLFEPTMRANLGDIDPQETEAALTEVLQAVFAKEGFREGQLEAIREVMEGRDCTVLLPTGGGKSLIYQMAGICQPGRTIVIDPLIALIEDQQRALAEHGIDKVAGFSSFQVSQGWLDALLQQVRSGDALFIFVAPERFQQRRFRDSVKELTQVTPINLAVIDEAHCVSEWGHQFRTSYLTLGKVLRDVCKGGFDLSPPLLALTGTASRAVLKDVLTQLAVSTESERSIVRPASFDRAELDMATRRSDPDNMRTVLSGTLRRLPTQFGVPYGDFFRPQAERTYSGLIFCPHVTGEFGISEIREATEEVVTFRPALYSGRAPQERGAATGESRNWDLRKREHAESFKGNRVPLMVCTNAFGMGIDKPNIRYVIHYGMPGSIEAYYQEVGRAGRDRGKARCLLIWSEKDPVRSDRLTITDGGLESVRREHDSLARAENDSITQQVYFLLKTFQGVDTELAEIEKVMSDEAFMPHLGRRGTVELVKANDEVASKRERAIYRLMLLGVVEDYLVESKFVLTTASVTSGDVADSLVGFVKRTDPGSRRPSITDLASQASGMELREAVTRAAGELVGFIYEVIVESRRRSLREMYVAARDASRREYLPATEGLRNRVLDYLTQGDISPILENLAESSEFDYADWEPELYKLDGVEDARELRGNSARLLVSSPSNPGLLFARAYSEILHPAGDLGDFESNFEASVTEARDNYGVSEQALDEFACRLLSRLETDSFEAMAQVLDVMGRLGLASDGITQMYEEALHRPGSDPGIRVLALANRMRQLTNALASTTGSINHGR